MRMKAMFKLDLQSRSGLISKEKSLDSFFSFMLFLLETKSWNSPGYLYLGSPLKLTLRELYK